MVKTACDDTLSGSLQTLPCCGIDLPPLTGPVWMLVHGQPLVDLDDSLRGWWAVTPSTVLSNGVVMASPRLDDDLCLFEGIEHLPIQQFVPESSIEGFAKAVVPGRGGFTVYRVWQANEITVLAWRAKSKGVVSFAGQPVIELLHHL